MPTRSRTSSQCAGSAARGAAAGGVLTTMAPMASIPCRASAIAIGAIAIGVIATGAGGNFSRGLRPPFPFRKGWRPAEKISQTLETKSGFHKFPVATARWSGRLMGPGQTRDQHRPCPVPLVPILLFGGSGYAHLGLLSPLAFDYRLRSPLRSRGIRPAGDRGQLSALQHRTARRRPLLNLAGGGRLLAR